MRFVSLPFGNRPKQRRLKPTGFSGFEPLITRLPFRLDVKPDGSSLLTTKISSGQGGYEPGRLIRNSIRKLSKEQTERFLARIEELQFWSLPTKEAEEPNVINLDGAEWVLEGTKDGDYHLVDRWSPDKGAVHALGIIMLIDLAKLKLLYQEVY